MHGENENGGAVFIFGNLPRGFQSAHDWHGYVHDDGVRAQFFGKLDGFLTVDSFAADFPVGTRREDRAYPLTNYFMIVNNKNSSWHRNYSVQELWRSVATKLDTM